MKLTQKLSIKQFYLIVSVVYSSACLAKQYITYGPLGLTKIGTFKEAKPEITAKCINTTIRIKDFDKLTLDYILISKDSFHIQLSNQESKNSLWLDQNHLSDLISLNCIKNKAKEFLIIKHRCLGNNVTCDTENHLVIDNRRLKILNSRRNFIECDEVCLKAIIKYDSQKQAK